MRGSLVVIALSALGLVALLAGGCATMTATPAAAAGAAAADEATPRQLQERQVIVTVPATSLERVTALGVDLARDHGLTQGGAFPLPSIGVHCVVFVVPPGRAIDDVVARLAADPRVESVQVNRLFRALADAPADPYASLQHGARAVRAWAAHRVATGRGVTVAVIDTGLDAGHPDLEGRVADWANFVEGGERTFARDRHGTAVAGVIAARADNRVGIVGIAPDATVVAAKACSPRTGRPSEAICSSWSLARAVDYSVTAGARVLNLSLAGPPDRLLERLLRRALERGVVVVAAALEDGPEAPGFPASLDQVIAVVSSDLRGMARAPAAAARGHTVAAPGVDIITTVPGRAWDYLSGSSLAAAHVSGIAALLLEREPRLSPADLRGLLLSTARPAAGGGAAGPSHADACAALARLAGDLDCPPAR